MCRLVVHIQAPDGMLDYKFDETASVDSSEGISETLVPCNEPEAEEVPHVEERPTDIHWRYFIENAPKDSPSQYLPVKSCIPKAFDNDFKFILYSSCDNYHKWIEEGVELMQSSEQLHKKVCY